MLYLIILALVALVLSSLTEDRWLPNGMPNNDYTGEKTPVRAVLSTVVGCPCKNYPGVNDFINMGMNFQYDMDTRYHPGKPEMAFYIDAVQQAPSIDLSRFSYDKLIQLLKDVGVREISVSEIKQNTNSLPKQANKNK
eukprot:gnl/Chilomastix_caulleri/758.p1 GENE.gnl/Chilomastix_caulleri/758~~gnl/Chilomastix_caulleri/758.p1  ORF type:complete len:138 (+),score=8.70 gnl/Chilomastix_caulleri/758:59-472(+)